MLDVKVGRMVAVFATTSNGGSGALLDVNRVYEVTKTLIRVAGHGDFKARDRRSKDGKKYLEICSEAKTAEYEAELERRYEEQERREDAEKKAAYEALPEAVKLAKKLEFFCSTAREATIASMPIETLRAAVAWIEANKLECE